MTSLDPFLNRGGSVTKAVDVKADSFSLGSTGVKLSRTPAAGNSLVLTLDRYDASTSSARISVTVGGRVVIVDSAVQDLFARETALTLIGGIDENITVTNTALNGGQRVYYVLTERG